jgi:hypothetical protein
MLHGSHGTNWVTLPSREWVDPKTGEIKYASLIEFTDDKAKEQFYRQALEAIKALLGDKFPQGEFKGRDERVSPLV